MEIVLIRHTSVDVPSGTCYGQTDVPLKNTFEQEASQTNGQLQTLAPFDAVFTSPLSRCRKLAAFCGYPEAKQDKRLLELNFGDWEMQRFDEINDSRLQLWYDDYLHVEATNGESFEQQYHRVANFLDELHTLPYQRVAIFAHGGVLICAQLYAGLITLDEAFQHLTPYGGIVILSDGKASQNPQCF